MGNRGFAGQYVADIPSSLLVRVLTEALADQPKNAKDGNEGTMFQHYVTQIFEKLDKDPTVDQDQIAGLEWSYWRVLEFSNRTPRALPKFMASSPVFFVQVLSTAYRGEKDEKSLDETPKITKSRSDGRSGLELVAQLGARARPIGRRQGVDGAVLEAWVREARIRLRKPSALQSATK